VQCEEREDRKEKERGKEKREETGMARKDG